MKTLFNTYVTGLFTLLLLLSAVSHAEVTKPPNLLPIETMRATVYSKGFAQRFALPDPAPGTEPAGPIQGLEFEMTQHRVMARYSCFLTLYLDGAIPIAWPEDSRIGVFAVPSRETQLLHNMTRERFLRLSVEDRRYFAERSSRYRRGVRLSTPDYQHFKQGGSLDVTIQEYDRALYPGLAFVKLDIGCSMTGTELGRYLKYGKGVELWFRKPEGKDYRQYMVTDAADFIRVQLPLTFLERIQPWIAEAERHNMIIAETEWKHDRDHKMKESEKQVRKWNRELADPVVREQLGDMLNRKP